MDNLEQKIYRKKSIFHLSYSTEIVLSYNLYIPDNICCNCLYSHKLYRQHSSLRRQFHHSIKHYRHVDACTKIYRTMALVVCCKSSVLLFVFLERIIHHWRTFYNLFHHFHAWIFQVEKDGIRTRTYNQIRIS